MKPLRGIDGITAEWLTDSLRGDGHLGSNGRVAEVAVSDLGVGRGYISQTVRVTPTYEGDPGSARSITSLEDELVLKYTPRLSAALRRRYATQTTPVPSWAKVVFDRAQQRAQRLAFRARAMTLRHEDHLDESLPV